LNSSDTQVIRDADRWLREGRRIHLVTVVRTWGSSPRPVGSVLAADDTGRVSGSVSGGCIEDDLLHRLRQGGHDSTPHLLCYGTTREEASRFGLPCGGRLELVIEPLHRPDALEGLNRHIQAGRLVRRSVDLRDGKTTVEPEQTTEGPCRFDGRTLSRVFGPRWHLLLIGAGHISQYLTGFAQALDFRITLCDPRREHARKWSSPGAALNHAMPDEAVADLADGRTAVVTLAHDPRLDDLALIEALVSDAFYIGALGSHRTSRQRRERLRQMGIPRSALDRLHAPVGLAIGSHTPAEIALSVMAEIAAVKNRRESAFAPLPRMAHDQAPRNRAG